ncbi:hypothetical protein NF556_19815 [Ornithinimicrobium faecis]|uniref:D-inositol 3-phosphate glycosyltransferase n=1 Tax=Ornithinimicrobium faecis TaxID=2934158 RepID=A0ABY4YT75_9MICO|nr:hypothetical protein [Ornithinimicrobium sp. HY1793]USQ79806.1 hypothetical protein NF556_19815 [Ornithinimicrobium sp. HY1793]
MTHVLMPVRTVADWGGLHEWALTAVGDLIAEGHTVTVAGGPGRFKDTVVAAGAGFIEVDWVDWQAAVDPCLVDRSWDKIFSHGPLASNLARALRRRTGAPIYHMIHGSYLDHINHWSHELECLLVASPAIQDFVVRIGKVEPWKVAVVANGAPDRVFELPLVRLAEKLAEERPVVATAARLAKDKLPQIDPTISLVQGISEVLDGRPLELMVMGDGPEKTLFESRLREGVPETVELNFVGWVDHDEVPRIFNRALATCTAGMGATRAVAAGTLTLAVGAQGSVGLQAGRNLRAGLWSNFGDHGCPRFTPTDLRSDIERALVGGVHDDIVARARSGCHFHRNQTHVRQQMLDALDL